MGSRSLPGRTTRRCVGQRAIWQTLSSTLNTLDPLKCRCRSLFGFPEMDSTEVEWMRNKLGAETFIRILAKGDLSPKEISRLIKILEAQKAVLEDEYLE